MDLAHDSILFLFIYFYDKIQTYGICSIMIAFTIMYYCYIYFLFVVSFFLGWYDMVYISNEVMPHDSWKKRRKENPEESLETTK